jgi:hypothetical protein
MEDETDSDRTRVRTPVDVHYFLRIKIGVWDRTPKKSSNGRETPIRSSFETTSLLCEFTFHSTEVALQHFFVNRSTTQLCIR